MADGVVVVARLGQLRNSVGGTWRLGAVHFHLNGALVGFKGNGDGALGGNILAVRLLCAVGFLPVVLILTGHSIRQGLSALVSDGLRLWGFLRGLSCGRLLSLYVFIVAFAGGQEVDSADEGENYYEGGGNNAERACLLLAFAGFQLALELAQRLFAALLIIWHRESTFLAIIGGMIQPDRF